MTAIYIFQIIKQTEKLIFTDSRSWFFYLSTILLRYDQGLAFYILNWIFLILKW